MESTVDKEKKAFLAGYRAGVFTGQAPMGLGWVDEDSAWDRYREDLKKKPSEPFPHGKMKMVTGQVVEATPANIAQDWKLRGF